MSNDRRPPSFRLTFKHEGVRYDCGTVWESDRFPGLFDVTFQEGDVAHERFPKMDMRKVAELAAKRDENGKHISFTGMSSPKPQGGGQRGGSAPRQGGNDAGQDFGGGGSFDAEIPF